MKKVGLFLLSCTLLATSVFPASIGKAAGPSFPYNATYPYGLSCQGSDQSSASSMVMKEYETWKNARVTSNGAGGNLRVQRGSSDGNDTVSEGIGYGMLFSVLCDDKSTFDGLWKYAKAHFNGNGLMGWHVDSNGGFVGSGGSGAATDAEEDMALALVFADKKWGGYNSDAKSLINNMFNCEVEKGSYVLKPGDSWGGSSITNPSYFAPAWYRVFAEYTGNNEWIKVADKCYEILNSCRNSSTGLVPDWCNSSGGRTSNGYNFSYDAIRTPWRIAMDYSWNGNTNAKSVCDSINKFFKNAGVASIVDGYTIDGSKTSTNHSTAFISCIASGSMVGTDDSFAKAMYEENVKIFDPWSAGYSYYGNCLRMMALLHTTGNFPNYYKFSEQPAPTNTPVPTNTKRPSNTPTSTPNNQFIPEDVNKDNSVNMADVVAIATCFNKTTNDSGYREEYDVNRDGSINMADVMQLALKFNMTY